MQTLSKIKESVAPIGRQYGIKRIYLFGSYAKGLATEESDVDLLIEKGSPLSLLMLSSLRQDFEEVLQLPVDLITTTGIDKKFEETISDSEILIYEE